MSNYDSFPNDSRLYGHCTIMYTHIWRIKEQKYCTQQKNYIPKKAYEKLYTYTKAIYKLNSCHNQLQPGKSHLYMRE